MWRRYGDVAFATIFAVAVSIEAIPLGYLTWTLAVRLADERGASGIGPVLLAAVGSTAAALILVTTYVLAYQHISERHDRVREERRRGWVVRWLRVLEGREPQPSDPLDPEAVEALLALRETMQGERSERIGDLLERHGAIGKLERGARSGRSVRRLEAITALATARIPSTLPTLVAAVRDPSLAVSVAATRAAARTLARVEDPIARDRDAAALVLAMDEGGLPYGVVEEAVVLAEEGATSLVSALLFADRPGTPALRAALDGVGRLKLLLFGEEVVGYLTHHDPEVRAAALRAVGRLGFLPESSRGAVITALADELDFIRIHATVAARLLPRPQALAFLSERLGDRSWWVRRAAADALVALGPAGLAELGRAARTHADRYARDMAEQALRDHVPSLVQAVVG